MPNDDMSWLTEPHIHTLFTDFPLPLVVLDSQGEVKRSNDAFSLTFPNNCLNTTQLKQLLHHQSGEEPVHFHAENCEMDVFVHVLQIDEECILVLEKSSVSEHDLEMRTLKRRIQELERTSASDRLTGAWNRAHFDHVINIELGRSVRYRQPVSLIFFDIDHFKRVNDTYGHALGDRVLCELVKVMNNNIRTSDMLFRWGGEEFAILATSTHYRAAGTLAETLRQKIASHVIEDVGNITISLGVAEYVSGENEESWFKRADAALYQAKNSGRNRVVVDTQGNSDTWSEESAGRVILRMDWQDAYCCGHPLIDAEHQQLFVLANTLINSTFKRAEDPDAFEQAMNALLTHVVQHFADEESVLAEYHYADLAIHARAHKRLVERALQLRDATLHGGVSVGELVDFLADEVVSRHMLKMDRLFYPLFHSQFSVKEKTSCAISC